MATITCPQPENVNPLRPGAFQFSIQKLPSVTFFVQTVQLPSLSLGVASQSTSVHDIKIPGETLEYGELNIQFQVDENLKNWNSIYYWMFGLGYPESHVIYKEYLNSDFNDFSQSELSKGYSDGQLMLLNSSNNPVQTFQFIDMFPSSLSGIEFDQTDTQSRAVTANASFQFTYYKVLNGAALPT